MWQISNQILICLLIVLFNIVNFAQVAKDKKKQTEKSTITTFQSKSGLSNRGNISQDEQSDFTKQSQFRSPFRYIILSNLTEEDLELTIPQRRLEILMDNKAFSVRNLKLLVELLKERFPIPIRLDIKIHTNLATIETPEEQDMLSQHISREFYANYYKTAGYSRDKDGDEALSYAYGRPPVFGWRTIILPR